MGRYIWMMVKCLSNFSEVWCTLFENLASITYGNFYFFLRFVHQFANICFGEVHKDDGIMLQKFQINIVYRLGDMAKIGLLQEGLELLQKLTYKISSTLPSIPSHIHTPHSYNHVSPPSNQLESQISSPHCNATGGPIMLHEAFMQLQGGDPARRTTQRAMMP